MRTTLYAILVLLLAAGCSANLIPNGSFEDGLAGWSCETCKEQWKTGSYWPVPDGQSCAYVDPYSGSEWIEWMRCSSALPEGTYRLSLEARTYNDWGTGITLWARLGESGASWSFSTEEWTEFTCELSGAGYLEIGASGPADNFVLVDVVQLATVPEPGAWAALLVGCAFLGRRLRTA